MEFRTADHLACFLEVRMEVQKRIAHWSEEALMATITWASVQGTRCLRHAKNTGVWLTVQQYTMNGTEMRTQEWYDTLFL